MRVPAKLSGLDSDPQKLPPRNKGEPETHRNFHYSKNTRGLIFVVDSTARERIQEGAQELQKVLREGEL